MLWDLDDLVTPLDIAIERGLARSIVCNWARRYDDFPEPLRTLSTGPVYSARQVREWMARRPWLGQPRRDR